MTFVFRKIIQQDYSDRNLLTENLSKFWDRQNTEKLEKMSKILLFPL